MDTFALACTALLGLFILAGVLTVYVTKNNEKLIKYTVGASFVVMILLVVFEILPESFASSIERLGTGLGISAVIFFTVIGILFITILDRFMPEHKHEDEGNDKMIHIGIISSIALIIHNIVEGSTVYLAYETSAGVGIMLCISIGLHNFPLGMMITSTLYHNPKQRFLNWLLMGLFIISSFIGGLIIGLMKINLENTILPFTLLSLSSGMLIYILIAELLPTIIKDFKQKEVKIGLLIGILIFMVGLVFATD
jgi:ZIP family zinc transporter